MKDFRDIGQLKLSRVVEVARSYQLFIACVVIVLCFAIGNDQYHAQAIVKKNSGLINTRKRVVDYRNALKAQGFGTIYNSDLKPRYLVDPKKSSQPSVMSMFAGSDACGPTAIPVPSLPYTDTSTTVGLVDDYDISGDPTGCPAPVCAARSGSFNDRGIAYLGTGTGPDAAYRIRFKFDANLVITLDPTDVGTSGNPIGDDLALIFYGDPCSSNPSDAIVIADNSASGNPPDLADNSEQITITNIPPGNYSIVVDGYTYAGDNPTAGPYTLTVDCVPSMTCIQPGYSASRVPR